MKIAKIIGITLCCALALQSCSKPESKEFLDTIPADCPLIAQIDIDAVLKMADCESHNGALSLTPDIKELICILDSALLSPLELTAAMGRYLDLTQAYVFKSEKPNAVIVTAPLREQYLNESQNIDMPILHNETQGWIALSQVDDLKACIDSIIVNAEKHPLSREPFLSDFLGAASTVRAIIPWRMILNPIGDSFDEILVSIELADRSISISAQASQADKLIAPFSQLSLVDNYALTRLPFNPTFALCIGMEEGTATVSGAPGGNAETIKQLSLDNWLIKLSLPTKMSLDLAANLIQRLGNKTYTQADSCYVAISNFDPEDFEILDNAVADIDCEKIIAEATIPYRSEAMKAFSLKQGYLLNAYANDSLLQASLRALGPSAYLLPTLINDCNRSIKSLRQ